MTFVIIAHMVVISIVCYFTSYTQMKQIIDKILNRRDPRTDPWGTPRFAVAQSLYLPIILTLGLWFCKQLIIRLQACSDRPYAFNFAVRRGILSKALERSIATVPTALPLSRAWRQYSVKRRITCWQLYPFLYADKVELNNSPKYSVNWSDIIFSNSLNVILRRFITL